MSKIVSHFSTLISIAIVFSICFIFFSTSTGYGQDTKPALALSFDENQGNVAKDLSGNGFHGKVSGAKWVKGKYGTALEFDGEDDFVEVGDAPELRLLKGGTLMAWAFIKKEKGHASWPRILIKSNTNGGTQGYDFLFDRAAGYSVRFCVGGACNSYFPLEVEKWYHVVAAFDQKLVYIYVNGDKVGEQAQPGPSIDTAGVVMRIGNSPNEPRQFHGVLDEIRIFSTALTKDEVVWHMKRGAEAFAVEAQRKLAVTWAGIKNGHVR
jgi:hypothetical protein